MEEDTSEEVLFDLDQMDISDLRLMARQNNLSTDGERLDLLSRIRESFGFDFDDQIEVTVASAKTKRLDEAPEQPAKRAKKVPASSTVTSATTGTSSAEVQPSDNRVEPNVPSTSFGNLF